jgi:hypothetical protein
MHVYQLFDEIRRRPGMYLDGDKSLKRLRSFVVGYHSGACSCGGQLKGGADLEKFDKWIADRLGFEGSTMGYCNMIISKAGSDEKAYEMFFDLLDLYRKPVNR